MAQQNAQSDRARSSRKGPMLVGGIVVAVLVGVVVATRLSRQAAHSGPGPATPKDTESIAGHQVPITHPVKGAPPADTESRAEELGAVASTRMSKRRQAVAKQLDPQQDGWQTEALSDSVGARLKQLGQWIAHSDKIEGIAAESLLAHGFSCGSLRPNDLKRVFEQPAIVVQRVPNDSSGSDDATYQGGTGLIKALNELAKPFAGATDAHVKFKIIRVTPSGQDVETVAYYQAAGHSPKKTVEQNALWRCRWELPGVGEPLLKSIKVENFEQTTSQGPGGVWFADCTQAVLGGNASFADQLLYGLDHWARHIESIHRMNLYLFSGMAVGDVNGDGLEDLYVCQYAGLPNRLFVRNSDGTATDRSHTAGVDWLDQTSSALLVDLDNDGDQDLVLATFSGLIVMSNDGQGSFEVATVETNLDSDTYSLTAVDYDHDGDLDLYVTTGFANHRPGGPVRDFVYHDANNGGANRLFRNDGDWKLTDVTQEVGLDENNRRYSLSAAWEDYDNDGDQDLYVANDYGQNCLYRNDEGQFHDVAPELDVVDFGSGMSANWGDFDRDGRMDLYVSNMFSSAGNRIATQKQFKSAVDQTTRGIYLRFAKGNTLFRQPADGVFQQVSKQAGVEIGRWAWGSTFADLNNDGWNDLLVGNGYITTDDTGDL